MHRFVGIDESPLSLCRQNREIINKIINQTIMKRENLLTIVIFIFFIFTRFYFAQGITETEKQQYITELSDSVKSFKAIEMVAKYRIVEAIPTIVEQLWKKDFFEQILFLQGNLQRNLKNSSEVPLMKLLIN